MHEAVNTSISSLISASKVPPSCDTIESQSCYDCGSSSYFSRGFGSNNRQALQCVMWKEMGQPSTKVHLPVPINVGGQLVYEIDTRASGSKQFNHWEVNNRLSESEVTDSIVDKTPLCPYQNAYKTGAQFVGNYNAKMPKDDALEEAKVTSLTTTMLTDDINLAHAIQESIDSQAIDLSNDTTPPRGSVSASSYQSAPSIVVIVSAAPLPLHRYL
jgi:hypothetical protein